MFFYFSVLTLSIIPRQPNILKKDGSITSCSICKGTVTGARIMSEYNSTDEIQTHLLSQCYTITLLDPNYYPLCKELSTAYLPIVLHLVNETEDDEKICIKLGYCSDLKRRYSRNTFQRNLHINKLMRAQKKTTQKKLSLIK